MSASESETELSSNNQKIVELLRESFRPSEQRLSPDVDPAVVYFPIAKGGDKE